ncbi:MAG: permease-like cell division protein FtsX [Proteobacteria bacterium]|nr:permease-like cell division protein FtsX [Pseudomonadota bacterium]
MRTRTKNKPRSMFKAWLLLHAQSFVYSLGQYYRNLLSSILTTAVIGISLALPGGFYLLLENAQQVTAGWGGSIQITAFLKPDIDDAVANTLVSRLLDSPNIEAAKFINRDQALAEYKELSGFSEVIDLLDENPLPSIVIIFPKIDALTEGKDRQIIDFIVSQSEVEVAQYDQQWVKRLYGIIEIIQRFVIIFSAFIGFGVLLIIGNTIRMAIYHHRSEIEITKLFGATNHFIRRPFLYSGFWYGLSGGVTSWLLLTLTLQFLKQPVNRLAELYASEFTLANLTVIEALILLACGIFLGLFGSWISVQRHIRTIEPA